MSENDKSCATCGGRGWTGEYRSREDPNPPTEPCVDCPEGRAAIAKHTGENDLTELVCGSSITPDDEVLPVTSKGPLTYWIHEMRGQRAFCNSECEMCGSFCTLHERELVLRAWPSLWGFSWSCLATTGNAKTFREAKQAAEMHAIAEGYQVKRLTP